MTEPQIERSVNSELENLDIWIRFKSNNDIKAKEELIIKYAHFVKYVAGRVAINLPPNVEFDDLVGYGTFGLIDAINKFDIERNVKFKTYAQMRIHGAIFDELRKLDWTPRSVRQRTKQLEKAYTELGNKLGRAATDEEIALELGIELKELYKLFNESKTSMFHSLDEIYKDDDNSTRMDFIEDDEAKNPETYLENEELKRSLADSIDNLPKREKLVISLYYFEELTLKEIGKILGVSDSRVSQLHTKAVIRLRGKIAK